MIRRRRYANSESSKLEKQNARFFSKRMIVESEDSVVYCLS